MSDDLKDKETTMTIRKDDAALLLGIDGKMDLFLPEPKEDDMIAGNALVIAAIGALISAKGQDFIDDIIEQFNKLPVEEQELKSDPKHDN